MKRPALGLVVVGAVVLAAAIGLWFVMKTDDAAPAETAAKPADGTAVTSVTPPPALPTPGVPGATVEPSLPRDQQPAAEAPREYMVGDKKIRDHRKGNPPPIDIPPSVHPPEGRKIHSNLTMEVSQKVRAVVTECAAAVPPEARGVKPRVEGQIVIAIKDKQTTITGATMQLRDVVGAAVAPTKACIEQKTVGIIHPTDEADIASYDITVSFAL